jgi:hypothetical protein
MVGLVGYRELHPGTGNEIDAVVLAALGLALSSGISYLLRAPGSNRSAHRHCGRLQRKPLAQRARLRAKERPTGAPLDALSLIRFLQSRRLAERMRQSDSGGDRAPRCSGGF